MPVINNDNKKNLTPQECAKQWVAAADAGNELSAGISGPVDWDAVIDLAGQHGLTGFVYAGLTAHGKGLVPVYYPEDKDLVSATLLGKEIQTLSPEEMLIHLCIHATSHCWDRLEWLAKAGYTHENWRVLKTDLKKLILSTEALPIENAEYGQMYEIRGEISGPNGNSLDVCTIWMTEFATSITKFITMYPDKRR